MALGSTFIIRPKPLTQEEITKATLQVKRRLVLRDFFKQNNQIPPLFHPSNNNWIPNTTYHRKLNNIFKDINNSSIPPQPVRENLTRHERTGKKHITTWLQNDAIQIVEADKNMGMVLLSKDEYKNRVLQEIRKLNNSFKVEPIQNNQLNALIRNSIMTRDSVIKLIRTKLRPMQHTKALLNYLSSNRETDFPTIKALPKLHKDGQRMRLLLPYHKNIFKNLHSFIAKVFQPIALRLETSLTSVYELVQLLTQTNFVKDIPQFQTSKITGTLLEQDLVITADLENMYNNINLPLAIDILLKEMTRYDEEFFMFGETLHENYQTWKEIITKSFSQNYFKFENYIIQQVYGVPMGSPAGPLIAVIFINSIIKNRMKEAIIDRSSILLMRMYIDDGFFIIRGKSKEQAKTIIHSLIQWPENTVQWEQDSLKILTAEELCKTKLSFLDTAITCRKLSQDIDLFQINTDIYTKPLGIQQYLHWRSAHPRAMKRSVIQGELNRRLRICSTQENFTIAVSELTSKLLTRQYPPKEIEEQLQKFPFSKGRMLLNKTVAKIKRKRFTSKNPYKQNNARTSTEQLVPLVIRYDPRFHREMTRRRQWIQDKITKEHGPTKRVVLAYRNNKKSRILSIVRSKA
jgi:hypothetical protein